MVQGTAARKAAGTAGAGKALPSKRGDQEQRRLKVISTILSMQDVAQHQRQAEKIHRPTWSAATGGPATPFKVNPPAGQSQAETAVFCLGRSQTSTPQEYTVVPGL